MNCCMLCPFASNNGTVCDNVPNEDVTSVTQIDSGYTLITTGWTMLLKLKHVHLIALSACSYSLFLVSYVN